MKLRHFIPWIPIIGIIFVILFPASTYINNYKGKYPIATQAAFKEYLWGNEILFALNAVSQGAACALLIFKYLI